MKKRTTGLGAFVCVLIGVLMIVGHAHAKVDWTIVNRIDLKSRAVDVASSQDGNLIFVLTSGEIVIYSVSKNRIENRIPVDEAFDRILYSDKNNTLVLSGGSSQSLRVIRVDWIHDIDISGLPFKGPADAPVIIATFDDYQ